ncbi:8-amino-7-oxononanoate synthase [Leptolyngbya ohadii]|uniref:8-amino-7-oxononanoate synthase n=1 Tax=Leptolyngbya ohadii TaxID=1962290 RepID=UPI0019D44CF1|nr:8-amino-7-oxononanoate synthase [Leptolyngbya ohadii]
MSIENSKADKFDFVDRALAERVEQQRFRSLQSVVPIDGVWVWKQGRKLLNFSANDYLGLSKHPVLIEAAQTYTHRYGTGATASRLVAGNYDIHHQLEEKLAAACGRESALLFSSGFQANMTILGALLNPQSCVFCDRLIHSSLIQGIRASGARFYRYAHSDLDQLERLLKKASSQSFDRLMIVTETVFSMDGDRSDVDALIRLANRYGAILYLDDAHAIGVLGKRGMGLAAFQPDVDLVVGTFGKAFGAFGAFVACSRKLRDYLINCCPGFIYTTALPPAVIGAIDAALDLIPNLDTERQHLTKQSQNLRDRLQAMGYSTLNSDTQIVPIVVGESARTLELSQALEAKDILAVAIRPPTVPEGSARIRLALSSQHQEEHLERLFEALEAYVH